MAVGTMIGASIFSIFGLGAQIAGKELPEAFLLSGVSGHGASSFYYPERAVEKCAVCHMPLAGSDDFAAADFDGDGLPERAALVTAEPGGDRVFMSIVGFRATDTGAVYVTIRYRR